jgi:hypothetical protein
VDLVPFSSGVRPTWYHRQYLRTRTCEDPDVYASLSSSSKDNVLITRQGNYLEADLGTPPGVLEEQVRAILIFITVSRFDKHRVAFKDRSSWVRRRPN